MSMKRTTDEKITAAAHSIARAIRKHDATGRHPDHGCTLVCVRDALEGGRRRLGVTRIIERAIDLRLVDYADGYFTPGPVKAAPAYRAPVGQYAEFEEAMAERTSERTS